MTIINTFQVDRICTAMERKGVNFEAIGHDAQMADAIETCIRVAYQELGDEGFKEILG